MVEDILWQGNLEKHTSRNPLVKIVMRKFMKDFMVLASKGSYRSILEVGCGEGFVASNLADRHPDAHITAIDREKAYIVYAKKENNRKNITYESYDLFSLPFERPGFDLVVCSQVLEHFSNFHDVFQIIRDLSRKDIIISVPNEPFFRMANMLRFRYIRRFGSTPDHVNTWSAGDIKKISRKYGRIKGFKTSTIWNIVLLEKKG